jgi:tRNA-2-methylthio-N6-dimethylallyladenosine synthase
VHVTQEELRPGDLAQVEIVESGPNSLGGRIVGA